MDNVRGAVLITGLSRRESIAYAIAARMIEE